MDPDCAVLVGTREHRHAKQSGGARRGVTRAKVEPHGRRRVGRLRRLGRHLADLDLLYQVLPGAKILANRFQRRKSLEVQVTLLVLGVMARKAIFLQKRSGQFCDEENSGIVLLYR